MGQYEPVEQSEHEINDAKRKRTLDWVSWRVTVLLGAFASTLVLALNGILLGLASHGAGGWSDGGIATVYEGDCVVTKNISTYGHIAINLLSTVLLSASNNCAQLLSSPSRDDLRVAHKEGKWMDIGVPSIRNLKHVPIWRASLWALLMLSSIPLHLLYNSVLFITYSRHESQFILVTEAFTNGAWWNETRLNQDTLDHGHLDVVESLQKSAVDNNLQRLDNAECLEAYMPTSYSTPHAYLNLLVVTSLEMNDSTIDQATYVSDYNFPWLNFPWLCGPDGTMQADGETSQISCSDRSGVFANAASWTPTRPYDCRNGDSGLSICQGGELTAPVIYCLAESYQPRECTAKLETNFLALVICCNAVKIIAMVIVACGRLQPLATVGDAIASFLADSAGSIEAQGPISAFDVDYPSETKVSRHLGSSGGKLYIKKPLRWKDGHAAFDRLVVCFLIAMAACIGALTLMILAIRDQRNRGVSRGFTLSITPADASLIGPTRTASLTANALLPNVPQVVVSFVYLFYNKALTSMLTTREFSKFASTRKPLRVSSPTGQQRSTYWLQVPYRYALPLMATMSALHWLISRSIFLVQVNHYDPKINLLPEKSTSGCGYSWPPLLLALLTGTLMIATIIGLSFRKLDPGIPLVESCSLAISAACSAAKEPGAATLPLKYGVLVSKPCDASGRRYVGFSSKEVAPLEDGMEYV